MKKIIFIVAVIFSLQALAVVQTAMPSKEVRRLVKVIATIHHYYIKSVDNKELMGSAISGMVGSLDPHSSYLTEKNMQELRLMTSGKFAGIGVKIIPVPGALKVITPLDDSPAKKAGIRSGDFIYRIDNTLVKSVSANKAISMIRGKRGTKVKLYIARKKTTKPLKLTVVRDIVKVDTVKVKLFDSYFGYIRIAMFNKRTLGGCLKAIARLDRETSNSLRGLVIDLRNNPGGMLIPAVKITDLFLDADQLKNKLIVYTKGYPNNRRTDFKAKKGEVLPKIPIVVLINEGSASAAEIMAGALQDQNRAVILGAKSFGKGSVQRLLPIDANTALKLTTALYYTPKGRSIQAEGVKPDVIVADLEIPKSKIDTLLFEPIYESYLQNHIANGNGKKQAQPKGENSKKLIYKDYQLYQALNVLKGLGAVK